MAKKRSKKKHSPSATKFIWFAVALLAIAALWFGIKAYQEIQLNHAPPMDDIGQNEPDIGQLIAPLINEEESDAITLVFEDELPNPVTQNKREPITQHDRHQLALIIDDVGYDMQALRRLLELPFTITVSILPDAPYAKQAAQMAYQHGIPVMLHMPMETTNPKYQNKMEDFYLYSAMSEELFTQVFEEALAKVSHVVGINNHMGSALTADDKSMQWLMALCKKHGLFFIDSRTSSKSVADDYAAQAGIAWNARDIFLDHIITEEGLQHAWESAVACVQRNDQCIMLAHPHKETLNFLENHIQGINAQDFVRITDALKGVTH